MRKAFLISLVDENKRAGTCERSGDCKCRPSASSSHQCDFTIQCEFQLGRSVSLLTLPYRVDVLRGTASVAFTAASGCFLTSHGKLSAKTRRFSTTSEI